MKAVVIEGFGSDGLLELRDVSTPIPKDHEVRIKIKSAGFNPVDFKIRKGYFGEDVNKILGCDCSGIVESLGSNVKDFKIGDEVYAMTFLRCSNGSYAEFVCVPVELVVKKPKNLTFEEASVIPLSSMTAYRNSMHHKENGSTFIAGIGGGVGMFTAQFFKPFKNVYTITRDKESLEFLHKTFGIPKENILIYLGRSFEELKVRLLEMNGGRFFDSTVDLVGGERKKLCLELTGYSGHFYTPVPESEQNFNFSIWGVSSIIFSRSITIHEVSIGAELGNSDRSYWQVYKEQLTLITDMIEKGMLKIPVLHSVGELSVESVKKAHDLLGQGHVKGKLFMNVAD